MGFGRRYDELWVLSLQLYLVNLNDLLLLAAGQREVVRGICSRVVRASIIMRFDIFRYDLTSFPLMVMVVVMALMWNNASCLQALSQWSRRALR